MSDVAPPKRRRSGGRAANTAKRLTSDINQMPWRLPINTDRPTEPLDGDGVQAIHDGAMRILEEIGIEFLNERNGLIEGVGLDDVNRVAKRVLDPAALTVVVVGNPENIEATHTILEDG